MRAFILGWITIGAACLLTGSCRKACDGTGEHKIIPLTPKNWEWFGFPEGTQMVYENNLGEKDTAVFGAIKIIETRGHHYDRDCYTEFPQQITQEITWLHDLKGRTRVIRLIGTGGARDTEISMGFSNGVSGSISDEYSKDTITINQIEYGDVAIRSCITSECLFESFIYSKSSFVLRQTILLNDNTQEIWEKK